VGLIELRGTVMSDAPSDTSAETVPPPPPARSRLIEWKAGLRWFGAEILVVVAGILIALAINAWWSERQEAHEERRLLLALMGEFKANQERLAEIVAFHKALKATTLTLLAHSAAPSTLSAEAADQLLADGSWWSSYTTLESTVLDAAVQDGQLRLIRNDALRRRLAAWRSDVSAAAAQSEQELMHYQNVWLPLLRAEAELGQISNRATVIPGTTTPYQGEKIPLPALSIDHRPLLGSRNARNALVQKLWIENDVLYQYERLQPFLEQVTGELQSEIRKRD
jgi:hypothetical protein